MALQSVVDIGSLYLGEKSLKGVFLNLSGNSQQYRIYLLDENEILPKKFTYAGKSNFISFGLNLDQSVCYVRGMNVGESLRGTGVIDILFQTICEICILLGITEIRSLTVRKPSISIKLTKWGFSPIVGDTFFTLRGKTQKGIKILDIHSSRIPLYLEPVSLNKQHVFYEVNKIIELPQGFCMLDNDAYPIQDTMRLQHINRNKKTPFDVERVLGSIVD